MKKFDFYAVIKAFYILMNADGEIAQKELEKFNEIVKTLEVELCLNLTTDYKEKVISEFDGKAKSSEKDYYDFLIEEINDAFGFSESVYAIQSLSGGAYVGEKIFSPRWVIWNMLAIALSNGDYHENEKGIIKYIAQKTDLGTDIMSELEQSIQAINAVDCEIQFVNENEEASPNYQELITELNNRRNVILNSVYYLIEDENVQTIEQLEVRKNAYSRAMDTVKEKTAPVTDAVKEKTAPVTNKVKEVTAPVAEAVTEKTSAVVSQVKDKIDESGVIDEISSKTGQLADGIKSKVKELEVEEKIGKFFNKFKK